jgi:cytidyltransferase-like protein
MARLRKSRKSKDSQVKSPKYALVGASGTFDVLHRGHRKLLKQAFLLGRKVMIGITTDEFAHTLHKPHRVDSYYKRKSELERQLARWGVLSRAKIVPLNDRFGPAIRDSRMDALVVSRRTAKTAYEINDKRRARGLKPIAIDPIDLLLADDKRPISSTRIRRGRIDREGHLVH